MGSSVLDDAVADSALESCSAPTEARADALDGERLRPRGRRARRHRRDALDGERQRHVGAVLDAATRSTANACAHVGAVLDAAAATRSTANACAHVGAVLDAAAATQSTAHS